MKNFIYGIDPVKTALCSFQRQRIDRLLVYQQIAKHQPTSLEKKVEEILTLAKQRPHNLDKSILKIQYTSKSELDRIVGGRPHQNVVLLTLPMVLKSIQVPTECMDEDGSLEAEGKRKVVVALDGIKDPQNLGAIIRTSYFYGATALVMPTYHQCSQITATVSKASAGVVEGWAKVYQTANLVEFISNAKATGWRVLGAATADVLSGKVACFQDRNIPKDWNKIVLVMGDEGKGISTRIMSECNGILTIPAQMAPPLNAVTGRLVDSLNVSVATGILLDRLMSQLA